MGRIESFFLAKRRDSASRLAQKADLTDSQGSASVFASAQDEHTVFLMQPAGKPPVLICGETQNPCSIEDHTEVGSTHGNCGADFNRPKIGNLWMIAALKTRNRW